MNRNEGSHDASKPKVILFVDDNVDTVQDHRDRLEEATGCRTYLCYSANAAVRYLERHSHDVILAVIDLYMPSNYDSLSSYFSKLPTGVKSNHGQLLGLYLRDKHTHIPYVYLSAFTASYTPPPNEQTKVFRKKSDDLGKFVTHCRHQLQSLSNEHLGTHDA